MARQEVWACGGQVRAVRRQTAALTKEHSAVDDERTVPAGAGHSPWRFSVELVEAMKTTGTCRYFEDRDVPDEVLYRAFDAARFGPQGGNRQPVHWIIVRDAERKRQLAELYLPMWKQYFSGLASGNVKANAIPKSVQAADDFAEHLHEVPVIAVLCAEIDGLHPTDTGLDRLSVVGGGSIYPVMQNFCLALRDQGVATAVTTLLCAQEAEVRTLLEIPEGVITAAHIAIGYPKNGFPRKLSRVPVEEFVHLETYTQPMYR